MVEPYTTRAAVRYANTTPQTRDEGHRWYPDFKRFCRRRGAELGVSTGTYAGIFAATSPTTSYAANLTITEAVIAGRRKVMAAHGAAPKIAEGAAPLDALRGPKVRAFYAAIMGRKSGDVVIDRWMVRVCGRPDNAVKTEYKRMSAAIIAAAALFNVDKHHFQATLWVDIRGKGTP